MSNDNTAPESACECKHEGLECGFCGTDITATIRALEAKVREVERERHDTNNEFAKVLADRDRLDLECARLTVDRGRLAAEVDRQVALCEQHRAAGIKSAAENARLAAEVAENDGVIAVWRRRTQEAEAEVAALREDAERYRWLKDHAYLWPTMPCTSVDQFERCALWIDDERVDIDAEIDAARRAGEGEE